jgi:multiple sugar transport system substrate-binding protein/raffinose/stachyose/melibiose transport system substrate-binding protein
MKIKTSFRRLRIGLALAGIFFLCSAVIAIHHHRDIAQKILQPETKELIFAHWQLEDGFREGVERAIREYEKLKAAQGINVKVRQIAVPVRGYSQWMMTQLLSGKPADVMELRGFSSLYNNHFIPLSPHITRPNPWNDGSPLRGMTWQESFSDNMITSLDPIYSEYFGVALFVFTTRLYVNMDLYRRACESDELPTTFTQWIDACKKIKAYGIRIGKPVIPIGVRGFDKATLQQLLHTYNSQLCAPLTEDASPFGGTLSTSEIFRRVNEGTLDKERLLAPLEVVCELGQYFADGFSAIDLEQTKYLFSQGNVGFFVDGTYNAWSIVNNSPFEVKVTRIPMLDSQHPLGKHAVDISESGYGVAGTFGVTKKSRHPELALDFLQYLSSWRVNQEMIVGSCKWMSTLRKVRYRGLMKQLAPETEAEYKPTPVFFSTGPKTHRAMISALERSIIQQPQNLTAYLWNDYIRCRPMVLEELRDIRTAALHNLSDQEAIRSSLAVFRNFLKPTAEQNALAELRAGSNLEAVVGRIRALDESLLLEEEIVKFREVRP